MLNSWRLLRISCGNQRTKLKTYFLIKKKRWDQLLIQFVIDCNKYDQKY